MGHLDLLRGGVSDLQGNDIQALSSLSFVLPQLLVEHMSVFSSSMRPLANRLAIGRRMPGLQNAAQRSATLEGRVVGGHRIIAVRMVGSPKISSVMTGGKRYHLRLCPVLPATPAGWSGEKFPVHLPETLGSWSSSAKMGNSSAAYFFRENSTVIVLVSRLEGVARRSRHKNRSVSRNLGATVRLTACPSRSRRSGGAGGEAFDFLWAGQRLIHGLYFDDVDVPVHPAQIRECHYPAA